MGGGSIRKIQFRLHFQRPKSDRPTAGIDPKPGFQTGLMNGREARESGLWLNALEAPGATLPETPQVGPKQASAII
jgi:hypothetical protein